MHNCECVNQNTNGHVNAFIDLNGIPYLLAEYLDRNNFQQIDRSQIKSEIIVDQSESMRAVIDVSIDDIGKRASDGYPAIIGNTTKHSNLLKMISDNCEIMDHQFNVLRRGIVIRVDYQLENYRTGQVIRSMTESFKIMDRNYFLDINPRNADDNAIIVNFCNTMVSTINEFTHGRDPMMMRITNIHMSYEMVKQSPKMPRIKQSLMGSSNPCMLPTNYGLEKDMYRYHDMMQNRHFMPGWDPNSFVPEDPTMIMPSTWSMFNRFYRFDSNASDIVIHGQEVNNPMTKVALIPCGVVRVNRTFMINPGHRIIFKFCIWKNDLTVINDTTQVAQCLRAPMVNDPSYGSNCNNFNIPVKQHSHIECTDHHHDNHCINPDYDTVIRMLHDSRNMERRQNNVINQLSNKLAELTAIVEKLVPSTPEEDPPAVEPDEPTGGDDVNGECCEEVHDDLQEQIDDLDQDLSNIQTTLDAIPDVVPIDSETIKEIVEENSIVE